MPYGAFTGSGAPSREPGPPSVMSAGVAGTSSLHANPAASKLARTNQRTRFITQVYRTFWKTEHSKNEFKYRASVLSRRPLHTLYGGAQLYRAGAIARVQTLSLETLARFGSALPAHTHAVFPLLRKKLETLPVEDQRVDFEDGYGVRTDEEEDGHAAQVAKEIAHAVQSDLALPPTIGIRTKAFSQATRLRAERTLEHFFGTYGLSKARLPDSFVMTLPKVSEESEVLAFREAVDAAVKRAGLDLAAIRFELMVEHPLALQDEHGRCPLKRFAEILGERCLAFHLGAYDLLSELGVPAPSQSLLHPHLDYARGTMMTAFAHTEIAVADGATSILPIPMYKVCSSEAQTAENHEGMREAFALHVAHVEHALKMGILQGWDLHPAQIVARFAALLTYFTKHLPGVLARHAKFTEAHAQATRVGASFDDAATARGLTVFLNHARALGVLT
jgi:citrate lyase beta subunit